MTPIMAAFIGKTLKKEPDILSVEHCEVFSVPHNQEHFECCIGKGMERSAPVYHE